MFTSHKHKPLSEAYRFDGFRNPEEIYDVFGDRVTRVITLVRRSKKRPTKDVVDRARFLIAGHGVFAIC